jgi:CBS domain-containing protein
VPAVDEVMSRVLLTIAPDAALAEAAKEMVARGVGAVLVLDGERFVAILTERDVLRAVAADSDVRERVSGWMTHNPETIEPSDSTDHAAALMIHGGFRHLPVVEEERVVGIVSIRDLMRLTIEDQAPRGA